MSAIERLKFEAVIEERDNARRECKRLRQELAAERAARAVVTTEQPPETELERRAWELYASAMAAENDISPPVSFSAAANWMAYRDEFRRDGAT